MAIKLQIRRDIKTNWDANSGVILLSGEIGYETDTRNMKIGDGATTWSALKYQAPYYTGTNSTLATTTLSVDQTNNRVGIGTSSPQGPLHINRGSVGENIIFGVSSTIGSIGQDASNNNVINAWTGHVFQTGSTERVRISSTGSVGIGTASPQSQLHLEGTAPIIRLKDTTSGTAEYSSIDADTSTGSISVNANPGNVAGVAASALVALKVNGNERFRANDTGVAITGTTTSSGLITASAGLTVPTGQALTVSGSGTVSVPAGSITGAAITANTLAPSKISDMAAAGVLGATAAGVVAALTTGSGGTAKTALGLGAAAYTDGPYVATGNQVGQIAFVTYGDSGTGSVAGVYTGVTSSSITGPDGGSNAAAPTFVSFGGTTTWSKPGSSTRYVRPSQGTWTCIQTGNPTGGTSQISMICIRTA
jgi:hypothetical protein